MRHKAVIFDMDGTILDTLDDLAGSVNHSLALFGYPTRSRDEIRSFLGNGMIRLIHLSVPDGISKEQEEAVLNEHKSYYPMHSCDMTRPYDGIVDLFRELKNRGIKTAVVSNKSDANVKALVSQFFNGLFDVSIGSTEGVARKPAADMVNMALERLGVSKEDAIYIGDSEVDLNTAKNSRLDMITVTWGFRDIDHLIQNGATVFANTPAQILDLL
ncbi:MAG: HAD family hydrolase [Lachnospiraceae bacterium]|nr:HAD family hydrolase [Lachnospiraceae bacterium]